MDSVLRWRKVVGEDAWEGVEGRTVRYMIMPSPDGSLFEALRVREVEKGSRVFGYLTNHEDPKKLRVLIARAHRGLAWIDAETREVVGERPQDPLVLWQGSTFRTGMGGSKPKASKSRKGASRKAGAASVAKPRGKVVRGARAKLLARARRGRVS